MFGSEASAQAAIENDDPEKQSYGKQDLPKAAEIEVFESLISDPDIADKPLDSCELTQRCSLSREREREFWKRWLPSGRPEVKHTYEQV